MSPEPETLAAAVRARHVSVHAFCRAHPELGRTTVYQLLRGKYPGDWEKQSGRVLTALASQEERPAGQDVRQPGGERKQYAKVLLRVACKHCKCKPTRKRCAACRELCRLQAAALAGG